MAAASRSQLLRLVRLGQRRQLIVFSSTSCPSFASCPSFTSCPSLHTTARPGRPSLLCLLLPPSTAPRSSLSTSVKLADAKKPLGLAEQVMADKVAAASKEEKQGEGEGEEKKEMPRWQKRLYTAMGVTFTGLIIGNMVIFSLPDRDEHGNDIEDQFSGLSFPSQNYNRLKDKIFSTKKAIEEPFSDKLLPDPLEPPFFQPKYTICLEVTGLLVNSDWTHKHGWRFQKRPGLDIFLSQVGYPNFEVVIWTVENSMTFYPIVNGMDPENRHVMYRLFRDATRFKDGCHVKDLYSLNRDLKRVIVVDWNEKTTMVSGDPR